MDTQNLISGNTNLDKNKQHNSLWTLTIVFAVSLPFLYQILKQETTTNEFVKSSSQVVTYLPDGLNINYTELMLDADQEEINEDYEEDTDEIEEFDDNFTKHGDNWDANHVSKLDRIKVPSISNEEYQKILDVQTERLTLYNSYCKKYKRKKRVPDFQNLNFTYFQFQKVHRIFYSAKNKFSELNSVKPAGIHEDSDLDLPSEFKKTTISKSSITGRYGSKFTFCIPPKTGTTNWQREFIKNFLHPHKPTENMLDPPMIFKVHPRVSQIGGTAQTLTKMAKKEGLLDKNPSGKGKSKQLNMKLRKNVVGSSADFFRGINVRHPFARLVSAYRQKFGTKYYTRHKATYQQWGKIMLYFDKKLYPDYESEDYIASFSSFLRMIVYLKHQKFMNPHWKSYEYLCSPCTFPYEYISQTETAANDSRVFFDRIIGDRDQSIQGAYGGHVFKARPFFKDVKPALVQKVYEIYREDFLMFGYTIYDDF